MNKKFTKLIAALALLVFMTPTLAGWGQTRTEEVLSTCRFGTSYNQGNSSYTGTFVVTNGSYTWTVGNGNNNNNGWTNGDGYGQVKFGRKNNASVGYITTNANYSEAITKVELTIDAITADKINSIKLYTSTDNSSWTETGSFEKSIGVKTVSISDPTEDFYYKIEFDCASGSSNGLITVSKVDYYYNAGSGPVIATPTFDPVGGEYPSTQNVTISCETQGSTIYYTTDGSTPDNTSTEYTGAITVSETTTIKAIAYVGNDASSVASATYTIVQPLTTMQAIFDKATEVGNTATYAYITLGNWVVSGVSTNGKNVFVTDGTKGFVIFDNGGNMGFSAGNILSGTVYCKVQLYNGFAELTLLNSSTSGISVATGGTVTAANIAMADLTGVNTGALVHYDNLTCNVNNNNYLLTDGTTTLQAFNSLYAFGSALVDNHVYNITGVYQQYTTSSTSTKEVLPRSADDIEEVVVIEPSVTVTPSSINAPFTGAEGTLTVTYENITEVLAEVYFCDANGEAATYGNWIQADIDEDNNVFYVIGANDGEARTAYLKVWAYDDDLINEVYSNLVTVNQAEYVAPTYAELPFSFNGGRDDIEGTDGLNQEGLGSDYSSSPKLKFDGTGDWLLLQFDERPGTLTFDIKNNSFSGGTFTVQTSEDGVTFTDLENYISITGTQSEEFDNLGENVRYIKWIYTEKSSGNVGLGNITLDEYVAPVPTIAIDPESISLTAAGTEFATATVSYTNLEERVAEICLYETYENGECSDKVTNNNNYWFAPSFATNNDEQIEYMAEANTGAARTVYMRVEALGGDSEMYYSNLVTVTQAAAPQQYTLTVTLNDNVSAIYVFNTEDVNNPLIEDGLAGTANVLEGTEIMVSPDVAEGYMLESLMINNENVISQLDESGAYTFTMPASNVTISATTVEQVVPTGGIITFGSGEGSTNINKATVTGNDSKGNTWTITTEGTNSFTPNANYAQVGSGNNPATSITFTTTLPASSVVSAFEAKFGGFNGTAGNITLMVDNNNVGTGSLNGTSDVIVSSNTTATGTVLTVTVTNIAKGVKCYYISYTLGESTDPYINLIADGDIYTPVDAYHMEFTYLPSGGQIDKVEYGNFQGELTYEDFHIQYCDAEGQHIDETPDWFGQYGAPHVVLNTTENLLYLDVETALNEGPARTCYFKVYAYVSASEAVYSNLVTVTQAAAPQPSITFTSNIAQFTPVDAYHIELNNTNEGGYIDQVVTENFQGTLVASDFHVEFCDANGGSVPANSDWLTVEVALPTWSTGPLYLEVAPIANEGAARTAYFKVWANNGNTPVYSDVVTVNQAAYVVTWDFPGDAIADRGLIFR